MSTTLPSFTVVRSTTGAASRVKVEE
jgi:hypothetical protein